MKEFFVTGETLPEAYHKALVILEEEGDIIPCTDHSATNGATQKEVCMRFFVENALAEPMISKLFIGDQRALQEYLMEMVDGINDFLVGKGYVYTYHSRLVDLDGVNQIDFVIDELRRNPESRRAVIITRDVKIDTKTDHPACLQNIQFLIREGKLHAKVVMRSNDAVQATFMNAFAFILLQKRIADELGIPVGSYAHQANSFHAYERSFRDLTTCVAQIKKRPDDLAWNYEGDWKEDMEEEIPAIDAATLELRLRKEKEVLY